MKINFSMWKRALAVIPRMSKQEWNELDVISKWLISTRFAVIIMTFFSACIAGLLAYKDGGYGAGGFTWIPFLCVTGGLVFAHATNNLLNDITDFKRGVDKDNYYRTQYGPQPVQQGLLSWGQIWTFVVVTGSIAVLFGLPLIVNNIWLEPARLMISFDLPALLLMLTGALFVLFYTWPLKYIGLGEVCVMLIWGPLMIGGGYYAITGRGDWEILKQVSLASMPIALAATTVLFGKHIDKSVQDKAKHIYTLPVILGQWLSRYTVLLMFALQYLVVFYLVYTGYFSYGVLIVLLALLYLIKPIKMFLKPRPTEKPASLQEGVWPLWFSAGAFYHTRMFEIFYFLGIILDLLLQRFWLQ